MGNVKEIRVDQPKIRISKELKSKFETLHSPQAGASGRINTSHYNVSGVGGGDSITAKNALRRNHQRMQSMNVGAGVMQNGLNASPSSDFNFTLNGGAPGMNSAM
jgi:hypothetical protein